MYHIMGIDLRLVQTNNLDYFRHIFPIYKFKYLNFNIFNMKMKKSNLLESSK